MNPVDYALIKKPYSGRDDECGDDGCFRIIDGNCFIAHFDALGHGAAAAEAAAAAVNFTEKTCGKEPDEIISGLHEVLTGSVGTVGFIGILDLESGDFRYSGIGNITARIYGYRRQSLRSADGIIGYSIRPPKTQTAVVYPGDIIVLTSDGITEHFVMEEYPDLLSGSSEDIAASFITLLGKDNDDSSCSVLRYLK